MHYALLHVNFSGFATLYFDEYTIWRFIHFHALEVVINVGAIIVDSDAFNTGEINDLHSVVCYIYLNRIFTC